jgi:hypothetical protein
MKKTQSPAQSGKPQDPEKKALMWRLLLHCVIILAIYFILVALHFEYIFHIYVGVGAVLGLSFVIYNRGFAAKGITPEMLPDSMTPTEKLEYIEAAKLRLKKSRWMLTALIPIILAIACDMFYLFVIQVFLV